MKFKSDRIIGEKRKRVIVETTENGTKIINTSPSKDDLKGLEEEPYVVIRKRPRKYTDYQLLEYLKLFHKKNGRSPVCTDFENSEYPDSDTYRKYFGSWNKALRMVGLDIDTMIKQGAFLNKNRRGRLFEIIVKNGFEDISTDLSGERSNSPCDGICPNGKTYEAKGSKLYIIDKCWNFGIKNRYREKIEYYYFGAFNKDWTILMYVWRVPGELVDKDYFIVNIYGGKFNIESMKKYDITNKFKDICKIDINNL